MPSLPRPIVAVFAAALLSCTGQPGDVGPNAADAFDEETLRADVAWLASPEREGRLPGSSGDEDVRAWVAGRFSELGLATLAGLDAYEQTFTDAEGRDTANLLAVIPGSDPTVAAELIVLSAHHDHLGAGFPGANDNASGVAGLLAIAEDLASGPAPRRSVLLAAFGSEESGFEGSEHFVTHLPGGLVADDVVYNVNLDMIGSYAASTVLYALGTREGTVGRSVVELLADDHPALDVDLGAWSDQSDNATFCQRGVPYAFFWTEDPDCYHRRCDTPDRVDHAHLVEIAALAGEVVRELADSGEDLRGGVKAGEDVCRRP
jgi:hypothetical protein